MIDGMHTPCIQNCRSLVVHELGGFEEVEALKAPWLELWQKCPDATPFQTPHWLIPFYQHFADSTATIVTLSLDANLVGILPLYRYGEEGGDRFLLAGSGLSDYLDVLVAPKIGCVPAIHSWMDRVGHSQVEFQQLRSNSVLAHLPAPAGWQRFVGPTNLSPQILVPDGQSDIAGVIPPTIRRELEYLGRRAAKLGPLTIRCSESDTLSCDIDSLFTLHSKRWQARGQTGVFASKQARDFFHAAWRELFNLGLLRLMHLVVGDWAVAALCGFSCRGHFYYYIGGFDPVAAKLSPGSLIIWRALQEAQREGCVVFDFLRGGESYKYRWGARAEKTFSVFFRRC